MMRDQLWRILRIDRTWCVVAFGLSLVLLLNACGKAGTAVPTPTGAPTEPVLATIHPDEGVFEPTVTPEGMATETAAGEGAYPPPATGTPYPGALPAQAPTSYPGSQPLEGPTTYPGAFPTYDYNPYPMGTATEGANPYPGGSNAYPGVTASPDARPLTAPTAGNQPAAPEPTTVPLPTATPANTPTPRPTRDIRAELHATDPATVQLASGKVQLVEFFAFWDGASKSMAPMMYGLESGYGTRINFIYLDIDDPATKRFKDQLRYRMQPHFFLLDANGSIIKQWQGYVEEQDLIAAFEAALR